MFWSPDGKRAAVVVPNNSKEFPSPGGLFLVDINGKLSAPLVSNVTFAAWLPDNSGLVVLRHLSATNWQEIRELVPRDETAAVEGLAIGLPGLIAGALDTVGGDFSAIDEKFFKPLKLNIGPAFMASLICLRDTQPQAFSNLVARLKDSEEVKNDLSDARDGIVKEISVLRLDGDRLVGAPLVIERTLAELGEPQPSPSAPVVAFLRDNVLTVAPLNGTNRITVNDKIAGSYDWTPDGRALMFAAGLSENWERGNMNIANIQRRVVVGPAGEPFEGESVLLATGAFPFSPRVRCLPDGRALFASHPLQLPAGASPAGEARFYVVDPAAGTNAVPLAIATAPGALPADLSGFAVSPDGRYVALGEYGSDSIALLEIATGRVEVISPNRGARNRTMPVWRGSQELYFAALPEAGAKRPEWFRWRKGVTPEKFSATWADHAVQNLLEIPQ